jgi:hypothetical protein
MTHTRAIGALTLGAMLSLGTATTRADIVNGQLPDLTPNRSVLAFAEVPDEKAKMILTGTLNGGQTVPPSPSQAAGVAYMGYYKKSNQICWQVTYTPLEGNEVDAHLHAGSVGEARTPFLLNLPPFPSTVKEGCASLDVTDKRTRN